MEKREDALREALGKNDEEIQRWETYIKDNKTAINNLNLFSKKLTVDVMVPIGKKAYIPGRLIHTNEVMVGHYQDYFSKCSAYTATEICKKRIENGKQHLEQLKAEKDLFQNKLEKPYVDGVLPRSEEREIIEEYDEERERVWKEKHRQRLREFKLKEKLQREQQLSEEIAHDELIQTLEDEEEILKELNKDLAEREVDKDDGTQEIVKKLMSGEMNLLPPKKRISHSAVKQDFSVQLEPVATKTNVQFVEPITNNLSENKFDIQNNSKVITDGNDSDTSIASDTPEEVRLIEKQAEYLPEGDRIGFFQYQLQIVSQKIVTHSFNNNKELEEKLRLFKIRDHLEELIEFLEEAVSSETDPQSSDLDKETKIDSMLENAPKRRISFASEDQMLEFRKNETVAQMMPNRSPTEEKPQRDIILLDEPILTEEQPDENGQNDSNRIVDRRKTILEKVEENIKTQNPEDFDLVNKIIDSSPEPTQTLYIPFKNSKESRANPGDVKSEGPGSPSDLFEMTHREENIDLSADNKPSLKETDQEKAYVDVRTEFFSPPSSENMKNMALSPQSKSILKNKSAVDREVHIIETEQKPNTPQQKKARKPKEEEEYLSAYNKVMSDVIENPSTEPDPLPDVKFVDMHTPKKRISRFKQMRNENK